MQAFPVGMINNGESKVVVKYFFETYGCQMNHAESVSVSRILNELGWTEAATPDDADLVLINTCSVRITAETRVFGRLGFFSALKKKKPLAILVMGCMAQRLLESLKTDYPFIDYVVGMFEREQFAPIFKEIEIKHKRLQFANEFTNLKLNEKPQSYVFAPSSYKDGSFQSYVPIMNGCNNFCTFCIVPHVRGRELSRPLADILAEVKDLGRRGVREITLLGQNVNSYHGIDENGASVDFPDLLRRIAHICDKDDTIGWIRFMSSHPKDMSDDLIQVIAEEPRVCKLVHLPVQHGSNSILKRMNRRYTREKYFSLVKKLRTTVSGLALSTDILIGFPGETEEDVEQTLELMQAVSFDSAFMYHYNPREGTPAYKFAEWIPHKVKIARLDRIIQLQLKTTAKKMEHRVGSQVKVLIESHSKNNYDELFGHTELGEMVVLEGKNSPQLIGQFANVRLQSLRGKTFRGILPDNP